jgi:molybdopterin converting factor small subunit
VIFGRKKPDGPPIRVDVRVHGVLGARYVSVHDEAQVPAGTTVRDLVERLHAEGKLDDETFQVVAGVRPPLTLLINGENVSRRGREKTDLRDGDAVSIFTPVTGG